MFERKKYWDRRKAGKRGQEPQEYSATIETDRRLTKKAVRKNSKRYRKLIKELEE